MGKYVQFYYVTFLLGLEETFLRTMSENTLVVSPIVRAKIIWSLDWDHLRILVKCPILLHHRLSALHIHGGASLLNVTVSLDEFFPQSKTRISPMSFKNSL